MQLESVGKLCDVFIKLKRLIDRKTLTDTYFAFVRPKLEYACIVWDDCGDTDKTRLEDMQLRFARAVTGAKQGTSQQNIYNEICWPLLSERRKNCKLKMTSETIDQGLKSTNIAYSWTVSGCGITYLMTLKT